MIYPVAPRADVVDTFFGKQVPDPFRPLEDPRAPAVRAWIEAENELTEGFIGKLPERDRARERMTALWRYERFGLPWKVAGRTFYYRNDGLQDQPVLWVLDPGAQEPRVLLDPNAMSKDGTVAITTQSVSEDGKLLAYGLSEGGSDWTVIRVRDVATAADLPDTIRWVKFGGATWKHDNSGFFYPRYPEQQNPLEAKNLHQKLFFHRVGTPESQDELVYERPDFPEWGFGTEILEDGSRLLISIWRGTDRRNALFCKDLRNANTPVVPLFDQFDADWHPIGSVGSSVWLKTDKDAPRARIVKIDLDAPGPLVAVVAEAEDALLDASVIGGRLILQYLNHAKSRALVTELDGRPVAEVALPGIGTVTGFGGRSDDPETWYAFTGFTTPNTIFRYDVQTGQSTPFRTPKVDVDPTLYETRQVFVDSADGTRVPMFVVHKKGLQRDGTNRTLLYGYGGFDISMTPAFSILNLLWIEAGGVYAVANLRGGGEYGEAWHAAGTLHGKPRVFEDFEACARRLVADGYTTHARIGIKGGSNGGLLVGACITRNPELYGAAVAQVGVLDMLRYQHFTIGWAWKSDYGLASDDEAMFRTLHGYSPLHNLVKGRAYPATLITTGDHDDRVVPAHSFKFAAALQEAQGGPAPVLIRVETKAGHGAGKPLAMVIEEAADVHAFLWDRLGS